MSRIQTLVATSALFISIAAGTAAFAPSAYCATDPLPSPPPTLPEEPPFPADCDALFDARLDLQKAKDAFTCYEAALKKPQTDPNETRRTQEGAFRSAAWLYTKLSGDQERLNVAIRGLNIATRIRNQTPKNPIGNLWDAIFTSLKCQIVDEGKVIPGCIMAEKKDIITNLEITRKNEFDLEGAGASRILGIMLTQMPKIVGGDKKRGETLLLEAITKAPDFSANFLELGRFYIENRRSPEGVKILNDFLAFNCITMNPTRAPECALDQASAKKLLAP